MAPDTTIRWFGGAAEAAQCSEEATSAETVAEAFDAVTAHRPAVAQVLPRCAVLLDGVRTDDWDTRLVGVEFIDVLPPFAGG